MQKLKSQTFCHLTQNVLKILAQNHITTIQDFLQEDVTKLAALTKLNLPEILAIRNDIFLKYSAPLITGPTLLNKVLRTRRQISTGIESLDTITGGGIPVGYITEVCGLAESGKTQLSFQLAINCVKDAENTVLYVDTKGDFSAVRIQKILDAQGFSHKDMAVLMHKIRVVHIFTMDELLELFKSIKNKTLVIDQLALIIVDSLPCLMFQYLGDESKIGLSLLNTLVNYSRFIGNEFNVGIVYINIQTRWIDSESYDPEDDREPTSFFKETTHIEKRNRCLGRYWEQIPALVLVMDKLEDSSKECHNIITKVKVSVISSINVTSDHCIINISANGVF
ncbi:rad51 recombinase D [Anticarsia gemmatalis]|uniref:rad51 recombinase D n=1 Tax=Anticarsia gemmatalis TaxID=129554 RepID=UPI003F75D96D